MADKDVASNEIDGVGAVILAHEKCLLCIVIHPFARCRAVWPGAASRPTSSGSAGGDVLKPDADPLGDGTRLGDGTDLTRKPQHI